MAFLVFFGEFLARGKTGIHRIRAVEAAAD